MRSEDVVEGVLAVGAEALEKFAVGQTARAVVRTRRVGRSRK
jgi:hypothetical protein